MAVQVIINGGFETGALRPGWRKTPGSASLEGGVTDTMSHTGSCCLELRAMDYVEQSFSGVTASASGPLTFWTKAASVIEVGPFYVNVTYHDGTSEPGVLVSPTDRWRKISVPVVKGRRLKRIQFALGESGSIYVDDVSLAGSRRVALPAVATASTVKRAAAERRPKRASAA